MLYQNLLNFIRTVLKNLIKTFKFPFVLGCKLYITDKNYT